MKSDSWWYDRLWAAMHLCESDSPEAVEALLEAVKDSDYLIRVHVCSSLLYLHGFKPDISLYEDIFENIITPEEGESSEGDYKKYEVAVN
ncbi:MAG: HEAT repeat domain-containing protein [Candidatus Freyarchaeota archaeon]|nr:HEAT repeat domain-containing protein [Candidatus Jordarchaeia archaeon]MBS7249823.1 HEAT repeat domain-containing protein [Candidatus Jordarchaeia archaeon]MBS7267496.1 HEAT repeat domain-containing protein [Candidatus Jordarchaeia archaeon]MBS7280058.1 HEAT repeat domain-containing protein [Candidatus Jordarchaeia archaeon]